MSTMEGFETVTLRSPSGDLEATFVPEAGMVGASLRHGGEELLGQRKGLRAYVERGATLGMPFLHPWANRLSIDHFTFAGRRAEVPLWADYVPHDEHGLAIHGLLEPSGAWQAEADGEINARLHFDDGDRAAAFPFPHVVTLRISLDDRELRIRVEIEPTQDVAVPIAFGFHPYLRLPGVPRRAWNVSLPAMVHEELDLDGIPTGRQTPSPAWARALGDRTFDDAYVDVARGAAFGLEGGGRRITVTFDDGYPVAQVFAPAVDDVVCFEPMTAPVNALVTHEGLRAVAPGDSFSATFSVRIETT
jgi:aldose 1-epimerase